MFNKHEHTCRNNFFCVNYASARTLVLRDKKQKCKKQQQEWHKAIFTHKSIGTYHKQWKKRELSLEDHILMTFITALTMHGHILTSDVSKL